ncbi:MAG TPA: hypothetical protein VLK55_10010, partial [Kocuria rosea]|nr:hypothetical protein [Kocuria rosea]
MLERSRPTTEVAKDSDHTRNTTLTVLIIAAHAIRATALLWCLSISDSGVAGLCPGSPARAWAKAGGSSSRRRITQATTTTAA